MPKLRKNTYAMRYVAGQPAERILPPGAFAGVSPVYPAGTPLSSDEKIRVLVWNIFKQQRAEWQSVLKNFGKDAHLVLLQEAQTTPDLRHALCRRTTCGENLASGGVCGRQSGLSRRRAIKQR